MKKNKVLLQRIWSSKVKKIVLFSVTSALLLSACAQADKESASVSASDRKIAEELNLPQSKAEQKECHLCGDNGLELLSYYEKKNAIVVLCLNTWHVSDTRLYDDNGRLANDKGSTSMNMTSHGDGYGSNSITMDSSRHNCDIQLWYDEKSVLDVNTLAEQLCQSCLDKVAGAVFDWGYSEDIVYHCDVIVDCKSGEIYGVAPPISGFYIKDWWVHIDRSDDDSHDNIYMIYNPKDR